MLKIRRMKTACRIAIVSGIGGVLGIGAKAMASRRDQDGWIKRASENAHHELDQFTPIAAALASGSTNYTALNRQLLYLQKEQINPATENNRKLVPNIMDVISNVNKFAGKEGDPEPGILAKIGLRGLIWFVDGIRDDKSYYLLDGAQLWADLRIKILRNQPGRATAVQELADGLASLQTKTVQVRDQLDGMAQIFVAGIKEIHSLTGDIAGNLAEIRRVAKTLDVASEQKQNFLDNSDDLEKETATLVEKYKN